MNLAFVWLWARGARDLMRIVFKSALGSMGAGIFAGVVLSLALSQIIAKWAQGNPRDPVILFAGTIFWPWCLGWLAQCRRVAPPKSIRWLRCVANSSVSPL